MTEGRRRVRVTRIRPASFVVHALVVALICISGYMALTDETSSHTHVVTDKWVEDDLLGPTYRIEWDDYDGDSVTDVYYRNTPIGYTETHEEMSTWFIVCAMLFVGLFILHWFLPFTKTRTYWKKDSGEVRRNEAD